MKTRIYILIGIVLLVSACGDDILIDDTLRPYYESFLIEAEKRNVEFQALESFIEMRIGVIEEDPTFLGKCNSNIDDINREVVINVLFWDILSPIEKEKLVFHELGHCLLNRPHRNDKAQTGFCASIMNSSDGCIDNYSDETREAYLDELFR